MNSRFIVAVLVVCGLFAAPVGADWDEGDGHKMHFPQLPDLTPEGLDVLAGPLAIPGGPLHEKFLADDWRCSQSGPVLDIHFWGSYNEDLQLLPPEQSFFSLVIFDNIPDPDGTGPEYSMPGNVLWERYLQPTAARPYAHAPEDFYDPNLGEIVGFDTEVWQFNFDIPQDEAFIQEEGKIYWLGVHHTMDLNMDGLIDFSDINDVAAAYPAAFGWKTADRNLYPDPYTGRHFEDDAVWLDVNSFANVDPHVVPQPGALWRELRYPNVHPFLGQSIDLSFVITIPEPATLVLLLGALAVAVVARDDR